MDDYITSKIKQALTPDAIVLNYQDKEYPIDTDKLLDDYLSSLRFDNYTVDDEEFIHVVEGVQSSTMNYPKWYSTMADGISYRVDNYQSAILHFIYYLRRF